MPLRLCIERGCGAITNQSRCPKHQLAPSPSSQVTAGHAHRQRRAEMLDALRTGQVVLCHLCGDPITSERDLEAHHVIPVSMDGAEGPLVPTHARCNRAKGNRA